MYNYKSWNGVCAMKSSYLVRSVWDGYIIPQKKFINSDTIRLLVALDALIAKDRKMEENQAVAYLIPAIAFLIVGMFSVMLGSVSVAVGLLVGALIFLLLCLFALTKTNRQMKDRTQKTISQ